MVSLRALEGLVAIVDHGSLTRAAARLRTSQPALSHQIAALERELGTPVMERLPRGVRPTAAGLAAAPEARIALAAADRAVLAGRQAAVWVDQFATDRGVVLPPPVLRTGSPRTAAQLAAAGMGVALVPFSALTPRTDATVRSIDPVEIRDVIAIVAAPHDDLLRRFVRDLKRRGLPESRVAPGSGTSGAAA
jgi:DNA-binding transcriptional LysR family regulator